MKIRRYFFPLYAGVPDDPNGDWVKWDDVKSLLERIKKLEQQLEFERSLEDKI